MGDKPLKRLTHKKEFRIKKKYYNVYYYRLRGWTNDPIWTYTLRGKKWKRQDFFKHALLNWIKHSLKWEYYLKNQVSILMDNYEEHKRKSDREALQEYRMRKSSDLLRNYLPRDWLVEEKDMATGEIIYYPVREFIDRYPPKYDF